MSASNVSFWITLVQLVFVPIQILGLYLCSKQFMRHYFAAKAMAALVQATFGAMAKANASTPDAVNPTLAKAAYEMADALLKAGEA